jgi:hypothetical protein
MNNEPIKNINDLPEEARTFKLSTFSRDNVGGGTIRATARVGQSKVRGHVYNEDTGNYVFGGVFPCCELIGVTNAKLEGLPQEPEPEHRFGPRPATARHNPAPAPRPLPAKQEPEDKRAGAIREIAKEANSHV